MKKSFLLVVNLERYNVCKAIEDNIQILWDNPKMNLSTGTQVFFYTNNHLLYRGVCGKNKHISEREVLPSKGAYWADCKAVKNMLEKGKFIEINNIRSIIPDVNNGEFDYETFGDISEELGDFMVLSSHELSEKAVEYFESLKWVKE